MREENSWSLSTFFLLMKPRKLSCREEIFGEAAVEVRLSYSWKLRWVVKIGGIGQGTRPIG